MGTWVLEVAKMGMYMAFPVEKYKSLVRMHLSFELELNTDE